MITLNGKNLRERQKELNLKVKEAAENKVNLRDVNAADNSDIDRIYKIGLASEYKNVDHIVEELKSGDSLYVSKALKCEWLYGSDYAHLINPDYLHHDIFPKMSLKMRKKMLSTISVYVRDETRAQLFYEYCITTRMNNNAFKFLIFTSESFKNEVMTDDSRFLDLHHQVNIDNFRHFIGNSFVLADTYFKSMGKSTFIVARNGKIKSIRQRTIIELSYLYSLCEEKFLDLFEKYAKISYNNKGVGVKMSISILKKHKSRILERPPLYLSILNKKELVKYSSSEDAQVYAAALLPDKDNKFWDGNYCRTYKYILDLIKTASMFEFVKKIFTDKYGTSEFEMTKQFYKLKYYDLMTFEEREAWALKHLQMQTDVISEDENYRWYEFIAFVKSFKEIKTQIYITTNIEKRSGMLEVLVKSAKTQSDLEELINYYNNRHVNERREIKTRFVRAVNAHHKVLEFEDSCWTAFDLLLHSLDIYNISKYWGFDDILTVSLTYQIINNKTLSGALKTYITSDECARNLKRLLDQLTNERKELLYNYIKQVIISLLSDFETQEYNQSVKSKVRPYLKRLEEFRRTFNKQQKYPDIAVKYMKLDFKNFKHILEQPKKTEKQTQITEGYLFRCLKKDAALIVEKLPLIKDQFNKSRRFRINMLLRRIKIFFSNDIAKQCLEFCTKTLYESLPDNAISEFQAIFSIVYAIFQLGDEKVKTELMDKFAPTNPKIENDKTGFYVVYTQDAICRFHSYSRPPLPLSKTALYIKGGYVHKCNDMLGMYLANLPPALLRDFIKLLLDSPLSSQKRGFRLAFETFEATDLEALVSSVWKKTKNVSLRQVIYLLLFTKMLNEKGKTQEDMCELLKELTVTIHQDDTAVVFDCFISYHVPNNLRGSYLQAAWTSVAALPDKKTSNFRRKKQVIKFIASNMSLMDEKYVERLSYDHVQRTLCEQKLCPAINSKIAELDPEMWNLVGCYIAYIPNEAKLEKSLKLVKLITKECFDHWHEDNNTGDLIFQEFFLNFVYILQSCASYFGTMYLKTIYIFEYLLETFENKFGITEMYSYFWDWKLGLIMRKVINGKTVCDMDASISFGLQLSVFIKELKDMNRYYISFFDKIVGKISSFINDLNYGRDPSLNDADIHVLVAYGLALTEMFETYVLALGILPWDASTISTPEMKNKYSEVLKKIRNQNNEELTSFYNDKFIYSSGCKIKKLSI